MKKILTVSLLAVMAVSGARADIASTKYVDEEIAALDGATATPATDSAAFVQSTTQADGKVTVTATEFANTVAEGGKIAPTAGAVYSAIENKVEGLKLDDTYAPKGATAQGIADAAQAAANAQATANAAVVANAGITAGEHAVITYDSKGLVTGGRALKNTDIPTIEQSQVNGLTAALESVNTAATTKANGTDAGIVAEAGNNDGIAIADGKVSVAVISDGEGAVVKSLVATANGIEYTLGGLVKEDIPTIEQSQVNGLEASLASKQAMLTDENVKVATEAISTGIGAGTTVISGVNVDPDGTLNFVTSKIVGGSDMEGYVSDAISEIETNVNTLRAFDASLTVNSKAVSESLNNMTEAGTYALTATVEKNEAGKLVVSGYAWEYIGR